MEQALRVMAIGSYDAHFLFSRAVCLCLVSVPWDFRDRLSFLCDGAFMTSPQFIHTLAAIHDKPLTMTSRE